MNENFMLRAIELAKFGEGKTNPNPLVGAVIVRDGKILAEGYHHAYGMLHAERDALKNASEKGIDVKGAEIFVTLEPCCHFGKQPPCTQALVEAGIKKVYVGSRDPNPLVSGKGNAFLREHGIEVIEDFMRKECDELNPIFFHYISTKMPYVALKFASTLDGKIATKDGNSKWITNDESRNFVQVLRNKYAGILCGIGTVLADDPMLNCRLENGSNPVRIVLDSNLRIPVESQLVKSAKDIPTIVACVKNQNLTDKIDILESLGLEVLQLSEENDKPSIKELMKILGEKKIDSVLVEGGAEINYAMLESGVVQHIYAFVAPKIFGGNGKSAIGGLGVSQVNEAFEFRLCSTHQFGSDLLIEYESKN